MDELQLRKLKAEYLDQYLFGYLRNLNDGFDSSGIAYFSEQNFEKVLGRIQQLGLGVYGIEPWMDGEYFSVDTFESYNTQSEDPKWYFTAFEKFKQLKKPLQYSASYHVSEDLLTGK